MFSFFRRKPRHLDATFDDLARMLTDDDENPTPRRQLLSKEKLDFSLDSLRHMDEYLGALHAAMPPEQDLLRVVLRCGAYVGEVIRRHSAIQYHWVDFEEAARHSRLVKEMGMSLGTAGILMASQDTMWFPLGKVCKYLENGDEDSVFFFAKTILEQTLHPS